MQALIWYTRFKYSRICVCTNTVQWALVEQRYRGTRRRNTLLNRPPAQARCRVSHSRNTLLNCRLHKHGAERASMFTAIAQAGFFMALRHGMNRHGADNAAKRIRHCADRGLSLNICKRLAVVFVCFFDCVSSQQACRREGGSKVALTAGM